VWLTAARHTVRSAMADFGRYVALLEIAPGPRYAVRSCHGLYTWQETVLLVLNIVAAVLGAACALLHCCCGSCARERRHTAEKIK
jgi:hypothetical protein